MTLDDIKSQIGTMEASIENILKKKYLTDSEKNYDEMITQRFIPQLRNYLTAFKERMKAVNSNKDEEAAIYNTLESTYQNLMHNLLNGVIIPGGSITYKLGNTTNASFSNCYYTPIEHDSMEGIFDTSTKLAKIFQYRGGSGIDLSILRPEGTPVNNSAKTSSGPVSFMPKFAADADIVGQNGRRAALMISMCIWHPDIEKFIQSKAYPEKVFYVNPLSNGRLPDISTANISVKITADFNKALAEGTMYQLRFPDMEDEHYGSEWKGDLLEWEAKGYKVKVYKEVDPEDILALISECAHKCGDPGILNWENTVKNSLGYFDERIKPRGVNPCAEQSLPDYGNCLLSAINLSSFVLKKWDFASMKKLPVIGNFREYYDLDKLREAVAANTLFLNLLIENNTHPLENNTKQDEYSRRIGIEFTALADTLAMLGITYGSEDSIKVAALITFTILDAAMEFSNKLSRAGIIAPAISTTSKLADYVSQPMMYNIYKDLVNATSEGHQAEIFPEGKDITNYIKSSFLYKYLYYITSEADSINSLSDFREAIHRKLSKDTLDIPTLSFANTSFNTVGPTGTISIIAGHVTSGIEPLFAISYLRMSTLTDGKPIEIIHYPILKFIEENQALLDYITGKEPDLPKLNFTIRELNLMNSFIETGDYTKLQELFYYKDAGSISYIDRIKMQSNIQKYVDASVSSTINLPEDTTEETILSIYETILKDSNIKGITIYRAGSKDGVLIKKTDNKNVDDLNESDVDYDESVNYNTVYKKKRSTEESAVSFCYRWKGVKIYITITIDSEENPMEVFVNLPKEAGYVTITQADGTQIKEFNDTVYREYCDTWHLVCRLTSLLLRTGCPVSEVMCQVDKATFNPFTSMAALLNRALNTVYKNTLEESDSLDRLREAITTGDNINIKQINKGDIILSTCPSCGVKSYIHSGGCSFCINDDCNYSKCS